jgi:deoxyinosine 3'endonuclease (endonuclease V)
LRPVQREAPAVVAAGIGLADELGVALVQGIGLEHQVQADQVGVAGQCRGLRG